MADNEGGVWTLENERQVTRPGYKILITYDARKCQQISHHSAYLVPEGRVAISGRHDSYIQHSISTSSTPGNVNAGNLGSPHQLMAS